MSYHHRPQIVRPPSAVMHCPVMNLAADDARKTTSPASKAWVCSYNGLILSLGMLARTRTCRSGNFKPFQCTSSAKQAGMCGKAKQSLKSVNHTQVARPKMSQQFHKFDCAMAHAWSVTEGLITQYMRGDRHSGIRCSQPTCDICSFSKPLCWCPV